MNKQLSIFLISLATIPFTNSILPMKKLKPIATLKLDDTSSDIALGKNCLLFLSNGNIKVLKLDDEKIKKISEIEYESKAPKKFKFNYKANKIAYINADLAIFPFNIPNLETYKKINLIYRKSIISAFDWHPKKDIFAIMLGLKNKKRKSFEIYEYIFNKQKNTFEPLKKITFTTETSQFPHSMHYSSNGKYMACALGSSPYYPNRLIILNLVNEKKRLSYYTKKIKCKFICIKTIPNKNAFIIIEDFKNEYLVNLIYINNKKIEKKILKTKKQIKDLDISPGGKTIAIAFKNKIKLLVNSDYKKIIENDHQIEKIKFTKNGKYLIALTKNQKNSYLKIWKNPFYNEASSIRKEDLLKRIQYVLELE